ncbi:MAG: sulfurtransferase [Actinomycetota bacterium]|nr:sulfurtransferase [Actinomycetota bacterium]
MSATKSDVLVGREWLLEHLYDPELVILEVDERPVLYRVGQIPGAHCLDGHTDLQDPVTRDIPNGQAVQALWRRTGIDDESLVVLYGDKNTWYACFACWLFRVYGLPRLAVLDGGRAALVTSGLPVSTIEPAPENSEPPPARLDPSLRASWRDVAEPETDPSQLIEVRTPEEYRGEMLTEPGYAEEAAQRPGHIPGALRIPWDQATREDGSFKSPAELETLFTASRLDRQTPTITYCRIGERSAHTWFVLHELLGWPDVRNYDGSWTEWGSMIGMSVALGEEPGAIALGWRPGLAGATTAAVR